MTRAPGKQALARTHPEQRPGCQGHGQSAWRLTLVPVQGTAGWGYLAGSQGPLRELWPCSGTLSSVAVHPSGRTGCPCKTPPACAGRTLDGKARPLGPCWLLSCQSPGATLTIRHPVPALGAPGPHSPPQGQDVDPLLHLQQPLGVPGQGHGVAVGGRAGEGQGGQGASPPSRPSLTAPRTSGSSGSSGWAEPSAGVCSLGRGCHVPCGESGGRGLRACRPGPSRVLQGGSARRYPHEGSSDLPGRSRCKGTDSRPTVDQTLSLGLCSSQHSGCHLAAGPMSASEKLPRSPEGGGGGALPSGRGRGRVLRVVVLVCFFSKHF